jgi:hypothetical protein
LLGNLGEGFIISSVEGEPRHKRLEEEYQRVC